MRAILAKFNAVPSVGAGGPWRHNPFCGEKAMPYSTEEAHLANVISNGQCTISQEDIGRLAT